METITGFTKARFDSLKKAAKHYDDLSQASQTAKDLADSFKQSRMDSQDALYTARQLEQIREAVYEIQYPQLKAKSFMSWDFSTDPGVESLTVKAIDRAGQPISIRGREKSIPNVEMKVTSKTMDFNTFGLAYSYSKQDLAAARYARVALQSMKAMACREIMAQYLDRLALVGDALLNNADTYQVQGTTVGGFFKASNTLTYSPTTDGTGGTTTFSTKPSDAIIADLGALVTKPVINSLGIETVDTLLLPLSVKCLLQEKRVGDGTSDMVLPFFMKNNAGLTVDWSAYLEVAGGSGAGTTRAVAYRNAPTVIQMMIADEFNQEAPQWDGLVCETITTFRTGGVAIWRPNGICFADGF